ncbi:hypothetical protein HYPSUDRAFT_42040 [Hypholoma sublateritium FD-334 SS-4]|uniref:Cytochrome P450 n=1 Tax=Hypholoma sublateritium (strain FD-334 SS-4) TaxID=945553 RepID=A0A0D2NRJ3_HYPSF|nr:hypothetical protein HYPSUDRAFT_42040 [Hypholoma sublateritium FD-334 SS-4]
MSSANPHIAMPPVDKNRITVQNILIALFLVFVVSKILAYRRGLKVVGCIPGVRAAFHPFTLPGAFIPSTWWNPGFAFAWKRRHTVYERYGNDTISFISLLVGPSAIHTANIDVVRQVTASGGTKGFHKPPEASTGIKQWGMNLVAAEGEVWRKHRRIMGPAFNNKLYEAVWITTLRTYRDMVADEGWAGRDQISVPVVQALTFKVALLVISKCGFGFSFSWSEPVRTADGRMSLQEAFRVVSETILITSFVPKWVRKLPFKRFRELNEANKEIMEFMQKQVADRKADIRSQGCTDSAQDTNAFSMLVEASENEKGKFKLDDSELIGNVFIMLLAGHETTAHTLAGTIGFLAMNDDLQEEIYQQIVEVVGHERDPVHGDYGKLDKVLSAFLEALRLFPSGYLLIRTAFEDTVLQIPNPRGEEGDKTIPVPKGTLVVVDMIGLQYNPRYFDNPKEYRPSRWYGMPIESEAFTAFSIGPRTCIGRKFATTEAVCFLTMLLRDYRIVPTLRGKETTTQWKERVLDAKLGITLGVKDVPVKFVRRRS